jgi:hypothetical protein
MSEVKTLIEKTINPPGITKKNRRALFSTISDVADIVRTDALKAFNAHFPYLADEAKLEEHGEALLVPHLLYDTPEEYRDRVSTASFFLMRSGERAYILEQLTTHFGDRYVLSDEFLNVYVKILDLSDTDRPWVYSFLDGLLNPNILFTVAGWFRISEYILLADMQRISCLNSFRDLFSQSCMHNGEYRHDGSINHGDVPRETAKDEMSDTYLTLTGMADAVESGDVFCMGYRFHHFRDGRYRHDGMIYHNGMVLIP